MRAAVIVLSIIAACVGLLLPPVDRDGPYRALAAAVGAAEAQQSQCGPAETVVAHLAEKYGEAPLWDGVAANGGLVTLFANPAGSTWTVTVMPPGGGVRCMVASGQSWAMPAPIPPGEAG